MVITVLTAVFIGILTKKTVTEDSIAAGMVTIIILMRDKDAYLTKVNFCEVIRLLPEIFRRNLIVVLLYK